MKVSEDFEKFYLPGYFKAILYKRKKYRLLNDINYKSCKIEAKK